MGGGVEVFDKQKSNKFPSTAIYLWSAAKNSTGSLSFDTFNTKERKKSYLQLLLGHSRDENRRKLFGTFGDVCLTHFVDLNLYSESRLM